MKYQTYSIPNCGVGIPMSLYFNLVLTLQIAVIIVFQTIHFLHACAGYPRDIIEVETGSLVVSLKILL